MRLRRFPALLIVLLSAACGSGAQEVLPISRSIIGASRIHAVDVVLQPTALAAVAALDERARNADPASPAGLAFQPLMRAVVQDAATRAGLSAGRPLRLVLDIDHLDVQGTGAALFGRADRLAGTVYLRDAGTGAALGQLYIDVGGAQAGPICLALRGDGVRERLARSFADRVAGALSGRKPPR